MLDEGLEMLTGLWSGEPFGHRGEHYRVAGDPPEQEWRAIFYPPPLQRPRIPIWVGGTWPIEAPFRRAARWDRPRCRTLYRASVDTDDFDS